MNIKEKLQALLAASNLTTGETDTTLTDAVQSLIDGYGGIATGVANIVPVVHKEVTITSALSGASSPLDATFVKAIYDDFSSLGTDLQSYMYAISFRGAKNNATCFVASSEQFFVNSASESNIRITFGSAYHKWWEKSNGAFSQKEASGQGCVVGAGYGATTTITPAAGWWAGTTAHVIAGTYDISVFRVSSRV